MGSLAISLSAYSCTHMHHRSSPPVVDAHRIPSVLAMRPSAYLDYKPLILPFLFLPPFSSQSRRYLDVDTMQVVASSNRFASFFLRRAVSLEIIRDGLFDIYLSYSMIIDWYFRCRSIIVSKPRERIITLRN